MTHKYSLKYSNQKKDYTPPKTIYQYHISLSTL
jgi:hypothetical protein